MQAHALTVFVAHELEGDVPWGTGEIIAGTVEINGTEEFFASAHAEADVFLLEHIGSERRGHGTGVEKRCGVADAAGFEQGEFFEMGLFEVGNIDEGVEFDARLEVLGLQAAAGGFDEPLPEGREIFFVDAQAGCHVVTAEWAEQVGAVGERFDQRQSLDAASAAVTVARLVKAYDNGGPVVFAAEARGDDADDAGVPSVAAHDDGAVSVGIKGFLELGMGGFEDVLFQFLTFAVADIELVGQAAGVAWVFGDKQVQRGLGGVEASGGVEAWTETETHVGGHDGRDDGGNIHEGAQALPFGLAQAHEAVADDDAVLTAQRGEVADGAHGGEIEKAAQIGFAGAGDFLQSVAEFENQCGGAEVGVAADDLRVDEGGAAGGTVFRFMVVDDDEIHAAGGEPFGFFVRGGAAVEGDEKRWLEVGEDAVESFAAEPVTLGFAQREKAACCESEPLQKTMEDGEGGDAIDIVVAVEHDFFLCFEGAREALRDGTNAGCVQRVGQRGEAWLQIVLGFAGVGQIAGGEQRGEERRDSQLTGQLLRQVRIRGFPCFPSGRQHGATLSESGDCGNAKGFAPPRGVSLR